MSDYSIYEFYPPPQHQEKQPGIETEMEPRPVAESPLYHPSDRLKDKVAIVTGGDSGIGRAVTYAFAKEGADVAVVYLDEHGDAEETKSRVEEIGRGCLLVAGDVGDETFCIEAVERTVAEFGRLDVVVNNAGEQYYRDRLEDITAEQLDHTFRTNVYSAFYVTKAALKYLGPGSTVINNASIVAYRGSAGLIDYSSTKGALVTFTRSLARSLVDRGIRVNAVAPGAVWTPLQVACFPAEAIPGYGRHNPMGRPGQPAEIAPCFVFLASDDSSYMSGQVLHPNGGEVING